MKHYTIAMYQNGISKETRSSVTGMMDDGITSTSSDYATTSKGKNNCSGTFKFQIKIIVYISKRRMMHCKVIFQKTGISLKPL